MKKILIWGAGGMALGLSKCFDKDVAEVIGYIDTDEGKKEKNVLGESRVMAPGSMKGLDYDFIFISSVVHQKEIFEYAVSIGIEREKIVSAAVTDNELGRVFDLFTERGMAYILHIRQSNRVNNILDNMNILNNKINYITQKVDCIYGQDRMRYTNLFLKKYYEEKAAKFIARNFIEAPDAPGKNVIFEERNLYYDYVLENVRHKEGLYLEFGVYKGSSINYISNRISPQIIYGFDSFEGLPEGWLPGYQQGKFNENGKLPVVNENVRLIKGWFDETLPGFIKAHKSEQCSFIHIDCDLYSSTKCVLSLLKDNIGRGTVICFDELAGQIGWQDDEYKALVEFVEETGLRFKYIACAFGGGHQLTERVAIEIL